MDELLPVSPKEFKHMMAWKSDKQARKERPIATGVLAYFPDAIAEVAHVSFVGNQQHNPGQPMHWARHKSTDQSDCIARHLTEAGTIDDDGLRHSAKLAWRALALLQLELEHAASAVAEQPKPTFVELVQKRRNERASAWLESKGTVYISGPMRGVKNHNFPAFDAARDRFLSWGYEVISPADLDRTDPQRDKVRAMSETDQCLYFSKRDLEAVSRCTHIAVLPGWDKSQGATAEVFVARWTQLPILDAMTGNLLGGWSVCI
jgi:hypothetical protein